MRTSLFSIYYIKIFENKLSSLIIQHHLYYDGVHKVISDKNGVFNACTEYSIIFYNGIFDVCQSNTLDATFCCLYIHSLFHPLGFE